MLPRVTRLLRIELVQSRLGLNIVEGDVPINDLARQGVRCVRYGSGERTDRRLRVQRKSARVP